MNSSRIIEWVWNLPLFPLIILILAMTGCFLYHTKQFMCTYKQRSYKYNLLKWPLLYCSILLYFPLFSFALLWFPLFSSSLFVTWCLSNLLYKATMTQVKNIWYKKGHYMYIDQKKCNDWSPWPSYFYIETSTNLCRRLGRCP